MRSKILLVFSIFMIVTSICSAFETPEAPRWWWVGSDDKFGYWIDTDTMQFKIDNNRYSNHYNHHYVIAWNTVYSAQDDTHFISKEEYDLDCRTTKLLHFTKYNSNGDPINSYSPSYSSPQAIIPGSWGEAILKDLELLRKLKLGIQE